MKQIILTFALVLTGLALFGQSPRIRLNQITKDSITGSIVLSGSDSNMVYSRDFYIGTDTSLVFYGTTIIAGGGGGGTFVTLPQLEDSLTGYVNTQTLSDSLLNYINSITLSDSLINYISKTAAFGGDVTGTYDNIAVTNDSHNHTITTLTGIQDSLNTKAALVHNHTITDIVGLQDSLNSKAALIHSHAISDVANLQDSLNNKAALVHSHTISDVAALQDSLNDKANDADLNNYLLTSNYIVDSTRINLTGDTAYYYQNGVLIGTGAIAGGGGGGSGTVTSITAGTFLSGGTITSTGTIALDTASAGLKTYIGDNIGTVNLATGVTGTLPVANGGTGATTLTSGAFLKGNGTSAVSGSSNLTETADTVFVAKYLNVDTSTLYVDAVNNRVGIGTSSPSLTLQVNGQIVAGNVHPTDYDNVTTNPGFHIGVVDPTAGSRAMNLVHYGGTVGSAASLFRIRKSRGTSVGDYTKVENNDALGYFEFMLSNGTGWSDGVGLYAYVDGATGSNDFPTRLEFYTVPDGSAAGTLKMVIKNNGNVGIGTGSPSEKLDVDGKVRIRNLTGTTTNDVFADANGVLATSSDERLKIYHSDIDNAINIINNLYPKYFYWKDNPIKRDLGFYAQEVNAVLPEGATPMNNDGFYGLNSRAIIAVTVKAIQEQQTIIETIQSELTDKSLIIQTQQQEIETLKTQIQNILTEINNLKNN